MYEGYHPIQKQQIILEVAQELGVEILEMKTDTAKGRCGQLFIKTYNLVGKPKTLTIKRDHLGGVFLCLVCEENARRFSSRARVLAAWRASR
ncbi:hypothetical protein BN341_18830 [Helicobacter heilmannii ASB1.4]|nr:hypothetical protein BN341_18830 [Helicobacter heilmannii ASB1.4]